MPRNAGPGRPIKLELDQKVTDRILLALRAGNDKKVAFAVAGIGSSTFYRWMEDERDIYREFRKAVEKAEADAEARNVAIIQQAAPSTWQAAAWWLERKHAERWGRTLVGHQVEGKVEIVVSYDGSPPTSVE